LPSIEAAISTKLLAAEPARHLGAMSFDAILGATAVKLVVVEDAEALERLRKHRDFVPRKLQMQMHIRDKDQYIVRRDTRSHMRKMAWLAIVARKKIPPRKRRAIALKASEARWRKPHGINGRTSSPAAT
jgi:hypothetical protein